MSCETNARLLLVVVSAVVLTDYGFWFLIWRLTLIVLIEGDHQLPFPSL